MGKKKCDSTHIILVHVELQFMRMKMLQGSAAFKKKNPDTAHLQANPKPKIIAINIPT